MQLNFRDFSRIMVLRSGIVLLFASLLFVQTAICQRADFSKINFTESVPTDLLAVRSMVLHDYNFTQAELEEIQKAFQQIGIDAEAYFETDVVFSGKDVAKAFASYFLSREVKYLIFLEKTGSDIILTCTAFDQTPELFNATQPAWRIRKNKLKDLLLVAFQDSWRSQKKKNFLVNDFPERDIRIDPIKGNRHEFYAIDLKVDNLAVPKFGNEAMDKELEQFFQANYPLKYKITEPGANEKDLRSQGFLYVLCFVHTRGRAAREILGYDMSKGENRYASITFPEGQLQLKILPADAEIYKFYFRHIDNGNVFLGTKWDADVSWQDALRNHISGFKMEAKIY